MRAAVAAAILVVLGSGLPLAAAPARVKDCTDCPTMVVIPPGRFEMGSPTDDRGADEGEFPRHMVTIDRAFALAETPVTVGDFARFAAATGHRVAPGCWVQTDRGWMDHPAAGWLAPGYAQDETHPVVCVAWNDAVAYAAWLSAKTGRRYRLPTEGEWEYAARAGSSTLNFWGDDDRLACAYGNVNDLTAKNRVAKVAVNCRDGFMFTAPAKSFRPNPFGLYDVIGNAWQFVEDCWDGDYTRTPRDGGAANVEPCEERVMRGSSWTDTPGPIRVAAREHRAPDARLAIAGFRVARDIDRATTR